MGEEFIRKYTESFVHRQDAAYEQELKRANLFSERPHVYHTVYRCVSFASGVSLAPGSDVLLNVRNEGGIAVLHNNRAVAGVREPDAAGLRTDIEATPLACGLVKARVIDGVGLGGSFTVTVVPEGGS